MNESPLFQQIQAAKSLGDMVLARRLLNQLVAAEPENKEAWLQLAEIANTAHQQSNCLRKALALDPHDVIVKMQLVQHGNRWVEEARKKSADPIQLEAWQKQLATASESEDVGPLLALWDEFDRAVLPKHTPPHSNQENLENKPKQQRKQRLSKFERKFIAFLNYPIGMIDKRHHRSLGSIPLWMFLFFILIALVIGLLPK